MLLTLSGIINQVDVNAMILLFDFLNIKNETYIGNLMGAKGN